MAEDYRGMAIGVFELESECICFVALDAAAKAANVKIQAVERNRLKAGACVKMRGSVSDVKAAMEAALDAARPLTKIVSHTVIASPSEDTETAIRMTIGKEDDDRKVTGRKDRYRYGIWRLWTGRSCG